MSTIESTAERHTDPALSEQTLCAAFQLTARERRDAVALRTEGDGVTITWGEYADHVRRIAEGLAALGLRRGDTLALLLTNRPDFNLVDAAAMHLGAIPFSIYTTSAPEQVAFMLRDSGARIAVTEAALGARLRDNVDQIVVVDGPGGLAELEALRVPDFDFDAAWREVSPDDLVTLIYTSGTTGPPKGVELTHANVLAGWRGMRGIWNDPMPDQHVISYLPAAHIAERFAAYYAQMLFGYTTTCCPDPRQVARLLPEVRPTQFSAVPRIWQKIKAAVEPRLPAPPDRLPGEARAAILEQLGLDRCEIATTAAAPMPDGVLEFFDALGLRIREIWGMSETCAVGTANPAGAERFGTVGLPVPGVELRLAADGEVLLRGDVLMRGYHNRPDLTVAAIDADGWLRTGDVGEFDEDGYLRIVDRKKELIVNAAGKNMSPANIEAAIKGASPLISQACVIGDARPYNVALITLDLEAVAGRPEDAISAELAAAIERANARLSRPEQIKRHLVLASDWEPGGPELTPTMKLRRRTIDERYANEIDSLYAAG
jgi:long-chain acyl-CoA synthetase